MCVDVPNELSAVAIALALLLAGTARAQGWPQFGRTPQHDGATPVGGPLLDFIAAAVVVDPFAATEIAQQDGDLGVHYPVPLVDQGDVVLITKAGTLTSVRKRETQTWHVMRYHWTDGVLVPQWTYDTDWKPVPWGSASWEPVYHPALTATAVWAEGAGGTIDEIDRQTGTLRQRYMPFGATIDPTIFAAGPPVVDTNGNVYYTAVRLAPPAPWTSDSLGAWLVRVSNGTTAIASYNAIIINAPAASDQCTTNFDVVQLPFPPAPDAIPPTTRCGPQRPGINVAPAVGPDGTIYVISRAHLNDRWGYLTAVNPDLTPRWTTSLRNRFDDGCNVTIPPNGTPGGCRTGATTGVDPAENQLGSGRVLDNASSSPVVTPDGNILYGAYTRYNYSQGHLMLFSNSGVYLGAYPWGWDITPAIFRHANAYSIITKENHYALGSYCSNDQICPPDRTTVTPNDPAAFFITQLGPALLPEWKYRSTNTRSCTRTPDGSLMCAVDHPNGFEWCVNAIAVDRHGTAYANSEDGNVYAITQEGQVASSIFLQLATGAAYTPIAIGDDHRVYTQNFGALFVIAQHPKRRAARPQ